MYIPKLLYEEYQKSKKENKILSTKLRCFSREYFCFIKSHLFSNKNFDSLNPTEKILFNNEEDYNNQKFLFEELDDFYKYRKTFLVFFHVYFSKLLFFGKQRIKDNFTLDWVKNSIKKSPNGFLGKIVFFSIFTYAILVFQQKYFQYIVANKININSKLGLYLWYEHNYRRGLINTYTLNFLDDNISQKLLLVDVKNKISQFNENTLEYVYFNYLLKQHFYNIYTTKIFTNIIIPLFNNEKENNKEVNNFLLKINKVFWQKLRAEKYYYYCDKDQEEYNYNSSLLFDNFFFRLFKPGDKLNVNAFSSKSPKAQQFSASLDNINCNEKIFLNEDSLQNLFRYDELNNIFLNDHFVESLKEFKNKHLTESINNIKL